MVVQLQVENLTKTYGADIIFQNISFGINEGDKIGLIAKNGTGKTTLLRILDGQEGYDAGKITFRNGIQVGYLPQVPDLRTNGTVLDACLAGNNLKCNAVKAYWDAVELNDQAKISDAIQAMDVAHAWDYEEQFKQILSQLKIVDHNQPISELSGGQIKRVALACVLINEPQLLILDEPTNHLDIEMIEWLEGYLQRSRISLLMVTHDRYFLDNVCTKIIELDEQTIYTYEGNYAYYLEKRAERIDTQQHQAEKARNLLRTELDWMRRQPQARAHKAQYRIDAFYDLKQRAQARPTDKDVDLRHHNTYIGNKIFTAHDVCKQFGDKVILDNLNYTFARYEKLGIIGDNGTGKSTFLKLLLGEVKPDSGFFEIGETVQFGYYSQDGIKFKEDQKVIDAVTAIADYVVFDSKTQYSAMQFLNLFLFSPRDQQKLISKLSGGEKRRLYLATILYKKPNFLILDEPTNDLDIATLEVLEEYLSKFSGCLIVVSHDRFFMDRTVDHTFVFCGNGVIKDFPGNYSEYRQWVKVHEENSAQTQKEKPTNEIARKPRPERTNKLTYKEKQELQALSVAIEQLTNEKTELEKIFEQAEAVDKMAELSARYEKVKEELDSKELRWLELSEKE